MTDEVSSDVRRITCAAGGNRGLSTSSAEQSSAPSRQGEGLGCGSDTRRATDAVEYRKCKEPSPNGEGFLRSGTPGGGFCDRIAEDEKKDLSALYRF